MPSFKKYSKASLESNVDRLFASVKEYRNSKTFKEMLRFCAHFRYLSPYNAFLVQQQCPGARYVLTAEKWLKEYDRVPLPNARPLIILWPFGPVGFVYEIADTQPSNPLSEKNTSVDEILRKLEAPYQTKGLLPHGLMNRFIANLVYHGIAFDPNFKAGAGYGAQIRLTGNKRKIPISIPIGKEQPLRRNADFLISVNRHADDETCFAAVCHELAHLFCYHLPCPFGDGWQMRGLDHAAKEFEAETAAWLVCERLNIENPSECYLAGYMEQNGEIPSQVSVDRIFFVANSILDMCNPLNAKGGLLYAFDTEFKKQVDGIAAAKINVGPVNREPSLFGD